MALLQDTTEEILSGLKAVADHSRLRILFALSHGELNVTELTIILDQSQPRVSRHLKVMSDAGLISRHKEGNWVLFQLREQGHGGALARSVVALLPTHSNLFAQDLVRLAEIRAKRAEQAQAYFASNARNWESLRALHVREDEVEQQMLALVEPFVAGRKIRQLVDIGTGTGRMLELFSPHADTMIGLDLSREMLSIARTKLAPLRHAQVRQADLYALPLSDRSADLVVIHQVLHFLDDPAAALLEARRITTPTGRVLIVDFAPHELEDLREQHAHRRLGIAAEQLAEWLARANMKIERHAVLAPPWLKSGKGLTVSVWLAAPIDYPIHATLEEAVSQ
jgi:ubiquinone/menaquinone biosynthesis C-methylase UbiE/DNA-binding transcriptional ArsR family regulator